MKIHIIVTNTKTGSGIEEKAYLSFDNAMKELAALAEERLKNLPGHINAEIKRVSNHTVEIHMNGTLMETYRIVTLETEDLGYTKESIMRNEAFPISCLSREDLDAQGFDTSNVTDSQMERLASKLGDDYCEQLFWTSLGIIAEDYMEIPKKTALSKLLPENGDEVDLSEDEDAPSWTFFDDDNDGYTDRATAVRLRNGKAEVRWEGERCHPACWEPLENIEDEDDFEDFIKTLTECVKEALKCGE